MEKRRASKLLNGWFTDNPGMSASPETGKCLCQKGKQQKRYNWGQCSFVLSAKWMSRINLRPIGNQ